MDFPFEQKLLLRGENWYLLSQFNERSELPSGTDNICLNSKASTLSTNIPNLNSLDPSGVLFFSNM